MDINVLRFVESRSRGREETPLGVLREGLREVIFEMGNRLYVVYPRYLVMRDVEFIHRTGENITVVTIGQPRDTLEQKIQRAREKTGRTNGEPVGEHAEFVRALGESMFLQKGRLTNYALRTRERDLLEEVFIDAPPALEMCFGEVVKMDRRRHGTEENMPGTRVLPESASRSGGKVSSRDQFGPIRHRRRSLGKPYAPVVRSRPTFERSRIKRQVPSFDAGESDTEDEDPATSQTLESPSQESSVPRKKKKASRGQSNGGSAPTAQGQPSTSTQQNVQVQQSMRVEPSVQAQLPTQVQPSTSAGRSAIQTVPQAPRRIEPRRLGPADNSHIQESAARRGSAFPRSFKFPGGDVFKMRRPDEARAWDIEASRAYIQHANVEANDPDWEEPELPWNSIPMGRYEGKQRTFTTPA